MRIQPSGAGPVNQRGLDCYDRLTDALLEAGICPLPTLYHWDLPKELEDRGGWPNRDTAARFADYAAMMGRALGDRIENWSLFNESKAFTQLSYWLGVFAPGRQDALAFLKDSHTINLDFVGLNYNLLTRVAASDLNSDILGLNVTAD